MSTRLADFREDAHFPSFSDLPEDDGDFVVTELYVPLNDSDVRFPKHWCFLGEIAEWDASSQMLTVYDKTGQRINVDLHSYFRLQPSLTGLRRGNTVAILYAFPSEYPSNWIRVPRRGNRFKIFPMKLDYLLQLSDKVQKYSTAVDRLRTCHGCEEKTKKLKMCAGCGFFWYCNKNCQYTAWREKGHRTDCKVLRDPDLQAMFRLRWDAFCNYFLFTMAPPTEPHLVAYERS
ncbi:hypothetical protein F4779DRAFT_610430 [Xylariaceae sp. FL0662B]|nr:hypothetical protein F4779DRAFT_610430 [Xylariaceae sp. FL0662B]